MLETERSSDEALRQTSFRRLYLGALQIDDSERRLKACYIILLAGRLGLRTGEIQHVREAWIDWKRGEIAIPRHDPCACTNCWVRAKQKAANNKEKAIEEIEEIVEEEFETEDNPSEIAEMYFQEDEVEKKIEEELAEKLEEDNINETQDNRTAEEILYADRWQPKYERSARRVPFGHSARLTGVISTFLNDNGYMDISQRTMLTIVKDAAEHADGIDPEYITIRGLRATAATHYATYISNPKNLQDIMGWTRIETASRYLRRAGVFTTDVVYDSFDNKFHSIPKPVIYPEEPTEKYPLLMNPLPYEREPFDPMLYRSDYRHKKGKMPNKESYLLIHPRSTDSPDSLFYEPNRHKIHTHEDYSSDITEYDDGSSRIEVPTMSEFLETHQRLSDQDLEDDSSKRKYKSEKDWAKKSIIQKQYDDDFTEVDESNRISDPFRIGLETMLSIADQATDKFVQITIDLFGPEAIEPPESRIKRVLIWIVGISFISIMLIFALIRTGIINPQTISFQITFIGFLSLLFALWLYYGYLKTGSLSGILKR